MSKTFGIRVLRVPARWVGAVASLAISRVGAVAAVKSIKKGYGAEMVTAALAGIRVEC